MSCPMSSPYKSWRSCNSSRWHLQKSVFKGLSQGSGKAILKAAKQPKEVEDDPVYDAVRMEAAKDARAQAAERALTEEERAERDRVRMQALEQARKLAPSSQAGNEAAEAAAALVAAKAMGGYAGRREVARREVCLCILSHAT